VLVLGVRRGEEHVASPGGDFEIKRGDRLVCYGAADQLQRIADGKLG